MLYVASPYTHPSAAIRRERAEIAENFAAFWAQRGKVVYCPIAAWHRIAVRLHMPTDAGFWMRLDLSILRRCDEVWVLMIDGWEGSIGVNKEIQIARLLHMPIRFFSEDNFAEVAIQPYTTDEVEGH